MSTPNYPTSEVAMDALAASVDVGLATLNSEIADFISKLSANNGAFKQASTSKRPADHGVFSKSQDMVRAAVINTVPTFGKWFKIRLNWGGAATLASYSYSNADGPHTSGTLDAAAAAIDTSLASLDADILAYESAMAGNNDAFRRVARSGAVGRPIFDHVVFSNARDNVRSAIIRQVPELARLFSIRYNFEGSSSLEGNSHATA